MNERERERERHVLKLRHTYIHIYIYELITLFSLPEDCTCLCLFLFRPGVYTAADGLVRSRALGLEGAVPPPCPRDDRGDELFELFEFFFDFLAPERGVVLPVGSSSRPRVSGDVNYTGLLYRVITVIIIYIYI